MKASIKKPIIYTSLGLLALIVAGLVVSVFSLGKIVKNRVETIGPQVTQVDVTLDSADVWLFPGRAQLKGLTVGNPPQYKAKVAFKVGEISVRMNPFTALSDKIVIDSIKVKAPEITIEGGLKKNNLTQIQKNMNDYVNGGSGSPPAAAAPAATTNAATRKFQINELVITGAKLHITSVLGTGQDLTVSLPEIRLVQLGAGDAGITSPEVAQKALAALLNSVAENAGKEIAKFGKDAVSKAKNFDVKKAGEKLKGIFGQ